VLVVSTSDIHANHYSHQAVPERPFRGLEGLSRTATPLARSLPSSYDSHFVLPLVVGISGTLNFSRTFPDIVGCSGTRSVSWAAAHVFKTVAAEIALCDDYVAHDASVSTVI
jgi:hypothetical protein